jgi:hypothetical protein
VADGGGDRNAMSVRVGVVLSGRLLNPQIFRRFLALVWDDVKTHLGAFSQQLKPAVSTAEM